jgi:transposase InsO family protein
MTTVSYRRQRNIKHQFLVPRALVKRVIRENHDPVYAAHPGMKRTCELLALNVWWPGMRKSIEDYVNECDSCQRRKGSHEYKGPSRRPRKSSSFIRSHFDGHYRTISSDPEKEKCLLTFIDHFSKYAEIFPIEDQSALTWARVYASQIITRHGSGSKLITDQGSAFMSSFFNETCKILGIQRSRTSSYHAE